MLKQKLLGAAFASADLIFEADNDGTITFALGSTQGVVTKADGSLIGQAWSTLFRPEDHDLLAAMLLSVQAGERKGPLRVTLASAAADAGGRPAALSVFRLPDRPENPLSCALSYHGLTGGASEAAPGPDTLVPAEDFPDAARRLMREAREAGLTVRVDLVELSGLDAVAAEADGEAFKRRVTATLRANSLNGEGASEVAPERYAVLRSASGPMSDLDAQLREVTGARISPVTAALQFAGSTDENIRALRYALDQYITEGARAAAGDFSAVVQKTAMEAVRLKAALAARTWSLVYQPVVRLADEELHHFEALARFDSGVSPQSSICLAEELGLIAEFDLAVARRVAKMLSVQPSNIEIAVNVSAVSLMLPAFHQSLAALTAGDTRLRRRLTLEVTETQKVPDLEGANRAIQSLRKLGHPVCLDDFGAGAASLDYLRQLEVDFVKFDGRYVRTLAVGSRDELILKHMVNLCRDLRIQTIAEMIEVAETARIARGLGVDLGQGWCFAKPGPELVHPARAPVAAARRRGAVQTWG